MSTFSPQLLFTEPTPFDPAVKGTWGILLNTNMVLIDSAIAGILSLNVAGAVDVTLTSNQGAADQARNQNFVFSGVLTGNINVFWPASRNRFFSVNNATTGAFTLTVAVVGTPGTTVVVPQGATVLLKSDGTNITERLNRFVTPLGVPSGGSGLAALTAHLLYVGNGTSALNSVAIGTSGQVLTSNGAGADPTFQAVTGGVSSIADDTNGGLHFSASTGAVTASLLPSDLLTKATAATTDSFVIMDAAASNVAKTQLVSAFVASSATTFTGTDTTKWLTAGGFGANVSAGTSGYAKLPGGVIMQYGSATVGGTSQTTVTFPVAFPTSCDSVSTTFNDTATGLSLPGAPCGAGSLTASNFSLSNGAGGAHLIGWIAFGH